MWFPIFMPDKKVLETTNSQLVVHSALWYHFCIQFAYLKLMMIMS